MTEQRKRIERGLRECAEDGVPDTVDLWPAIREHVSGQRASGERVTGQSIGERAVGSLRRRWLPRLVPNTLLGWTLAVLSVLILGVGAYAASWPVADLLRHGLPGPAGPGVREQPDGGSGGSSSVDEERAVREVVELFGARLISVTLSVPDESVVARHIRKEYRPFVTPELLESWATNPQNAPGRAVSSPWPDKIEVLEAREVEEGLFRVEGEVIYMSSAEIAKGGAAYRERVVLSVRKGRDGTWRISEYRRQSGSTSPQGVTSYENLSRAHTEGNVDYEQSPPVGGEHNPVWQNCGFYAAPVREENAVHSLEHGAVWITYQPDLPQDDVERLRELASGQSYILASPYEDLPSPVVASAWGKQVQLESASDLDLERFINAYRQGPQTPESGAPCTGGVGSPE